MDEVFSNVKIVILGTPTVGKTSLRRSYIGENFRKNYIETIGSDFSFTSLEVNDTSIGLALWDLAGQEKFINVHPLFYKGSYGCVVVYSCVDRETYDQVEVWVDRFIQMSNRPNLPIMLIGNKIDLLYEVDDFVSEEDHQVLFNKLSKKLPGHKISEFRTSALTGENVKEGFTHFAKIVYDWIISNAGVDTAKESYEDDIDKNIPGAYAIVMNQITGPIVLTSSPSVDLGTKLYGDLSNSAIKLVASLDFNDIISQSSIISTYPWIEPQGYFFYIAFVLDNSKARGNKELFIVGVNVNRELNEPITGIKGVLDGLLYNTVNEIVRSVTESGLDLVTTRVDLSAPIYSTMTKELNEILAKLRLKLHESLKRWYHIP